MNVPFSLAKAGTLKVISIAHTRVMIFIFI
jgi:hypothetical protein